MKHLLILAVLLMGASIPAKAACPPFKVLPTGLNLLNPDISDGFDIWAQCISETIIIINDGAASTTTVAVSTFGHIIRDEGVDLPKQAFIDFVGPGVTVTDEAGRTQVEILAAATGDVIRSTATRFPEATTTLNTWDTVAGSTLTLVLAGSNFIRVDFSCNLECISNTSCPVGFALMMDGDFFDGVTSSTDTALHFQKTDGMNTSSPEPVSMSYKTTIKPAPGPHDFALLWVSGGGVPIKIGRNTLGCSLTYREEPETLSTGSLAIVNGVTDFGAQTKVSLQSLACAVLPCKASGFGDNFDAWTSTGTLPGQHRNSRTGQGPFD